MTIVDNMLQLLNEQTMLQFSAIILAASFSSLCRFVHKVYESRANSVQSAPVYFIDEDFIDTLKKSEQKRMPYVALCGLVASNETPLACHFRPDVRGVAINRKTCEVKQKWLSFSKKWEDEDIVVSCVSDEIPFSLRGVSCDLPLVKVENPSLSDWFENSLQVVHEEFTPKGPSNMLDSVMNLANGEYIKGYNETEKVLKIGTKLLVIGEVVWENDGIKIHSPLTSILDFVVTQKSINEIFSDIQKLSFFWKILSGLAFGFTAASSYYFLRSLRFRYLEIVSKNRERMDLEAIRQRRSEFRQRQQSNNEMQQANACVVCLENPRECVLLDCGHVCLCGDCLERLPHPLTCPICRESVVRCLPLYNV